MTDFEAWWRAFHFVHNVPHGKCCKFMAMVAFNRALTANSPLFGIPKDQGHVLIKDDFGWQEAEWSEDRNGWVDMQGFDLDEPLFWMPLPTEPEQETEE